MKLVVSDRGLFDGSIDVARSGRDTCGGAGVSAEIEEFGCLGLEVLRLGTRSTQTKDGLAGRSAAEVRWLGALSEMGLHRL
jgi:hypothetical protein